MLSTSILSTISLTLGPPRETPNKLPPDRWTFWTTFLDNWLQKNKPNKVYEYKHITCGPIRKNIISVKHRKKFIYAPVGIVVQNCSVVRKSVITKIIWLFGNIFYVHVLRYNNKKIILLARFDGETYSCFPQKLRSIFFLALFSKKNSF